MSSSHSIYGLLWNFETLLTRIPVLLRRVPLMKRNWKARKKVLTIICVGVRTSYGHQSYEDSNLEGQDRLTRLLKARCKGSHDDVITFLDHLPSIWIDDRFSVCSFRVYFPYITKVGIG